GRLRLARRRRPDPRLLRPDRPPPLEPRRRPPAQPRPTHDHPPPPRPPPGDEALRRPPNRRRKDAARDQALPQAPPRPAPLPAPREQSDPRLKRPDRRPITRDDSSPARRSAPTSSTTDRSEPKRVQIPQIARLDKHRSIIPEHWPTSETRHLGCENRVRARGAA